MTTATKIVTQLDDDLQSNTKRRLVADLWIAQGNKPYGPRAKKAHEAYEKFAKTWGRKTTDQILAATAEVKPADAPKACRVPAAQLDTGDLRPEVALAAQQDTPKVLQARDAVIEVREAAKPAVPDDGLTKGERRAVVAHEKRMTTLTRTYDVCLPKIRAVSPEAADYIEALGVEGIASKLVIKEDGSAYPMMSDNWNHTLYRVCQYLELPRVKI